MAPEWSNGKRCGVAIAALLLLGACSPQYGWQDVENQEQIDIPAQVTELSLSVELDAGYEAAEGFVQRLTVRQGAAEHDLSLPNLDTPFLISLEEPTEAADLSLVIGFCESTEKEVCFVETATLTLLPQPDRDNEPADSVLALTYRPRPPL
jgi:hypothetical protein